MAYGDIATLAQIAPTLAGAFAGQNQAQDVQMNDLKQKELADLIMQRQQDAQQRAQMNPLMLQHQGLLNQGLQAGLPGIAADASLKQTNAQKASGTLQTDIDSANTDNRMKMYTTVGQHLGSLSGAIDDHPEVPPHLVLAQQIQNLNLPQQQAQALMQRYANVPAAQLSARLKADGDRLLKETPSYVTQQSQNESHERVAAGNNATSVRVANINANSRIQVAQARAQKTAGTIYEQVLNGRIKLNEMPAAFTIAAQRAQDPEERDSLLNEAAKAEQLIKQKAAASGVGKPDAAAIAGLPAVEQPPLYGGGATPPAQPQAAPAGAPQAQIQQGAQKAWGAYEPEKYNYRIGPNGQLQRKAK